MASVCQIRRRRLTASIGKPYTGIMLRRRSIQRYSVSAIFITSALNSKGYVQIRKFLWDRLSTTYPFCREVYYTSHTVIYYDRHDRSILE